MVTAAKPTAAKKPERKRYAFQWRAFVALSLVWVALFLVLSGLVLYVAPSGRVAKTTDWNLLWLDKGQWEAVHTVMGFAFLVLAGLHLKYNWRSVLAYMRRKSQEAFRWRWEFVWASLVALVLLWAAILDLPPVAQVMRFGSSVDSFWEERGRERGFFVVDEEDVHPEEGEKVEEAVATPKRGYGKLSVAELAKQEGVSVEEALARLARHGAAAEPGDNLLALSGRTGFTPSELAAIVRGEGPEDGSTER
ncbi:DUF4405 domain-containing protein [Oceanithermus sp.]